MRRILFLASIVVVAVSCMGTASAILVVAGPSAGDPTNSAPPPVLPIPGEVSTLASAILLDVEPPDVPEDPVQWLIDQVCNPCPDPGAATQGDPQDFKPTCAGCRAANTLAWNDHWSWEQVWVKLSQNQAGEPIQEQASHAALIQKQDKNCANLDGPIRWSDSMRVWWETNGEALRSGSSTGWNDTWVLASGHDWWNGGGRWGVQNGEADICATF